MKKVTDKDSKYYIPIEDRIVVFDLDGTLYCETFPIYGEWLMFADYVLNTPQYTPSEEVKARPAPSLPSSQTQISQLE